MHALAIYKRRPGLKDQKYGKQLRDQRLRSIVLCGGQTSLPRRAFLREDCNRLVLALSLSVAIGIAIELLVSRGQTLFAQALID